MGEVISGAALFEKLLEKPQSLFDRVWEIAVRETGPHDTPERRAGLKVKLMEMAASIQHPDVRAQYRKMLLDRFDATFFSSRRPAPKRSAQVVDMRAFAARRHIPDDGMALLNELSRVEDDLAEATRLLAENCTDSAFRYQQDLVRARDDIMLRIADSDGGND